MMLIVSVAIAISLYSNDIYGSLSEAMRHSTFQVVSYTTTTGFATADANLWTPFAIVLLMFGSVVCGCAGSTAGGIKVDRMVIAAKVVRNRIKQQQHPNAVISTKIDGVVRDDGTQSIVMTFLVAYVMLVLIGTIINAMFGCDLLTGFSAAIACISNVGPGFGEVGSMDNYSELPAILKLNASLLMLVGRLEIFGFIQLFFIRSWR